MKKSVKKLAIAGVFACALAAVSAGASSWNVASADVVTNTNITMLETASLRPENTELEIDFGLRFKTQINKAWFDGLGEDAQVYTVLLPSKMLGTAELTASTADIQTADIDETKKYVVGDNYLFNVVLTDIPSDYYTADICARSYVVSGDDIYYATNTASRSVVTVANGAVELDIENGENRYEAVEKYLVSGISVSDTGLALDNEIGKMNASLSYYEGTSDAVKAFLDEKYTLTCESNDTAVAEVDSTTRSLTPITVGEAQITVHCEALGLSKTATVSVYQPTYGELFDFENIDVTGLVYYNTPYNLQAVEHNGKQAISFEVRSAGEQGAAGFYAHTPDWFINKTFDTVNVTVLLKEESGDTSMNWLFLSNNNWSTYNGNGNYQLSAAGDEKTFTLGLANPCTNGKNFYKDSANGYKGCAFYVKARNPITANATFYITDVTFGINDIESAGETVNLYDKFYTSAGNATFTFTPSGSTTATTIEDPTAFLAGKSGTITATVSAEGYSAGTVTANYTRKLAYGTLIDFNAIDESALSVDNTAGLGTTEVGVVSYKGKQAIAITTTRTATTNTFYFGVKIAKPDWFYDFDYVTVSAELIEETNSNTHYCLFDRTNETTQLAYMLKNEGDTISPKVALGEEGEAGDHYNYLKNDPLKFSFRARHNVTMEKVVIYITDITFGYNDIAVTSGSSVSLLDTLGYAEGELTNVTFDGAAVSDLTAFAPTASGTLSFTVNKEGYAPATFTTNVVVS